MKKIVNLVALLLLASSSVTFTACKDYDEDNYNELRAELENQNQTLKQLIENQKASLQSQLDALKQTLENVKQCTCDPSDVDKKIEIALKEYLAAHPDLSVEDIRNIIKSETAAFVTAEQLQTAVANLEKAIENLNSKHNNDIQEVLEKINIANQAAADAAALAKSAQKLAQEALDEAKAAGSQASENKAKIAALESIVSSLQTTVANLDTTIQGLSEKVKKALKDASDALAQANANKSEIEKLWIAVNAASGGEVDLSNYYTKDEVKELFNDYFTKYEVETLLNRYASKEELALEAQNIKTFVINYVTQIMSNLDVYTKGEVDAKVSTLTSSVQALEGRMNTVEIDIRTIKGDISTANGKIDGITGDITSINGNIATINSNIGTIQSDIDTINTKLDNIIGLLNKLVSGIVVQGATNKVFGQFRLPANINSNMLITYYGKSVNDVKFPSTSSTNYAALAVDSRLTPAEAEIIGLSGVEKEEVGSGFTLVSDAVGSAGTVYVTVNPSNYDFTGTMLALETSQGVDAGIELTPLAKSDEELKFGMTRAADNGFYESKATISAGAIQSGAVQTIDIDAEGFANIARNLKNRLQGTEEFNASAMIETVYNQLSAKLNAYAAKVNCVDEATGVERSVTSQYNIAAAAFTPLSYNFGYTFYGRSQFWGYEYADKLIDKVGEKVTAKLQQASQAIIGSINLPEAPTLQRITLDRLDPNDPSVAHFEITILNEITIDGVVYEIKKDTDGKYYYYNKATGIKKDNTPVENIEIWTPKQDLTIELPAEAGGGTINKVIPAEKLLVLPVAIDLRSELADFYNNMVTQVEDMNQMIDAIQDYLDDINGLLDNLAIEETLTNTANDVTSTLQSILNRVNSKLVRFLDAAILKMQPALFFTTNNSGKTSLHYPTSAMNNPSVVESGDVVLAPLSFTAEILNPAYKKHVACVNVVKAGRSAQAGDADCLKVLQEVNSQNNMNVVVDGFVRQIPVNLPAGYTYQFAYSALDYTGVMSTVRTAIRVK